MIVLDPQTEGLGVMLAELLRGNLSKHPERARYLTGSGTVNVMATDAGVEAGLRFADGALHVGPPLVKPDLSISSTSEVLLSLSSVPLRFGMPDSFTREGRHVNGMLFKGTLKVKGMLRHLKLMANLNRLLSVR